MNEFIRKLTTVVFVFSYVFAVIGLYYVLPLFGLGFLMGTGFVFFWYYIWGFVFNSDLGGTRDG